jgi:hypothetical protein
MWRFQFFPPQNLMNLGHFSPKKTFEEFTMPKKKKTRRRRRRKNQCEFAKKQTLLLAIETLQNPFIFEFLVFKIFFLAKIHE